MSATSGLLIAVLAVSTSSIFVRWCGDTPALVISFFRMFWSTLLLLLYQLKVNPSALRYSGLSAKSKKFIGLAGILLALHFATWIASVQMTKISHSLILESTHPVFALVLSPFLLQEKGNIRSIAAAILTFLGILVIAGQDVGLSGGKFAGDLLALASALFVTLYIFIARHQRHNIDLIPYLIAVYAGATIVLFILIVATGESVFHYPLKTHVFMLLLALIPTGIGHSLINWAARRMEAYKVNFSILGEPVIASLLAYMIFHEQPYGFFYLGAFMIVGGIVLALLDRPGRLKKVAVDSTRAASDAGISRDGSKPGS